MRARSSVSSVHPGVHPELSSCRGRPGRARFDKLAMQTPRKGCHELNFLAAAGGEATLLRASSAFCWWGSNSMRLLSVAGQLSNGTEFFGPPVLDSITGCHGET